MKNLAFATAWLLWVAVAGGGAALAAHSFIYCTPTVQPSCLFK